MSLLSTDLAVGAALPAAESGHRLHALLVDDRVTVLVDRVRADARLEAELEVCDSAGIPHSFFLGGPLRWSDDDRDKAIAYKRVQRQRCSACGTFPDEWYDADGRPVDELVFKPVAVDCFTCAERDGFVRELQKSGRDLDGVSVRMVRFDPALDDDDGRGG